MRDHALAQAIDLVGGNAALARFLGISREAVSQWDRCPAERVVAVSEATGGRIQPEQLRPDIFRRVEPKLEDLPEARAS